MGKEYCMYLMGSVQFGNGIHHVADATHVLELFGLNLFARDFTDFHHQVNGIYAVYVQIFI